MSDRIHVATRKGVFTVTRGADGWAVSGVDFLGDHAGLIHVDPRDGTLFAAMALGHFGVKLHRSRDGGKSWDEIAKPTYPEKPEGLEDKDGWGKEIPWNTEVIWSLASGGADQPGRLWAGTIPGGLFKSDDAGDSWALVESLWNDPRRAKWMGGGMDLPGLHSICVDPRDSGRVVIGVSCGGVWVTEDDGATWEVRAEGMRAAYMPPDDADNPLIQDPHQLAMSPSDPDVVWAQHHNGIFRSVDGCGHWTELQDVQPSSFGFPVVVHPREPDTAWFVPAVKDECRIPVDGKVVVTRTRDGGKTFDVLSKGLPQTFAYDLTFRHALDIDSSGDRLAFGTTTGSLFVSEDQGDSWQVVSTHLPPVDAVRFS